MSTASKTSKISTKMDICDYFLPPNPEAIPRPLVIDGCNIGRSASGLARTYVDCAGLVAVARWLLSKNFDVTVFLPVVYNNINNYNARNTELLHKLERMGIVTFTPARSGRGMRKAFINYDDLYVVSYAARHGGCILSGDKFKDILNQTCYSDFHEVIRHRTIDVKFRPLSLDFVSYRDDLFYKHAPEFFIYENSSVRSSAIRKKLFVLPDQEGYQFAKTHRRRMSPEKRELVCCQLDELLYSMSVAEGKEFRNVDFLPYLDLVQNSRIFKIEDIFPAEFCREFHKANPEIVTSFDPLSPYVMEPIIRYNSESLEEIDETSTESPSPISISDEKLIDVFGTPPLDHVAPQDQKAEIHPDLADLEIGPKLPRDLSSSALLEWYTRAEIARKI